MFDKKTITLWLLSPWRIIENKTCHWSKLQIQTQISKPYAKHGILYMWIFKSVSYSFKKLANGERLTADDAVANGRQKSFGIGESNSSVAGRRGDAMRFPTSEMNVGIGGVTSSTLLSHGTSRVLDLNGRVLQRSCSHLRSTRVLRLMIRFDVT